MHSLRCNNTLNERNKYTGQGTRADYEVDQMGHFRLELFGEYRIFR